MRTPVRPLLTLLLSLALAGSAAADTPPPLATRLDRVIDQAIADQRIVGTVVLVAQDGKLVYHRAAGYADREAKRPMREDALFRLASMSKTLVSATALALVDQGKLTLDEPITRWLPTFRPKLADGREAPITVRQLLTHTAGLSYGFGDPGTDPYLQARVSNGMDQPGLSMEENLQRIASVPLLFEPGTRWNYSVATDVLGAVLIRAGGAPLPTLVERLLTRPLGMAGTGFTVKARDRLAVPYTDASPAPARVDGPRQVNAGEMHFAVDPTRVFDARSFPSGGAGMVGSAKDYVAFLEALRTGKLPGLKKTTLAQMTSNQLGGAAMSTPGLGFTFGASVLLDPELAHTPQSRGTYAWGGAYGHSWFVDPERRLTVVALTNTFPEGMSGAFPTALRDALYAAPTP
ncbi:serine hydrolase domain-containing protein [Stigmatella erecta]|uniref:CubicO group peptidase, beta-lactamase class C family n=1 Tax=Stigmatella erecta TaxID=83460 RepID=A0A1I0KS58_9BACT|nr:serine hydrolase domain-containing protein [Stigmatella erecta]SEU28376.1 CubicO group peptidase, beta-lactamase class C family [Stigmatella erecta]